MTFVEKTCDDGLDARFKRPLKRIQVVAPSSPFDPTKLQAGLKRLRQAGFSVDGTESPLRVGHPYLNGTDRKRTEELKAAFQSESDLVWMARGGYGLTRLSQLLHDFPSSEGPVCIGFSDVTALLGALFNRGLPCIHGPLITTVGAEPEDSFQHLVGLLTDGKGVKESFQLKVLCGKSQSVSGRLFAGNLCVLTHLVGTPWMPNLDGAVLCLEEVGERPYRIDRMLTQLLHSRALDKVVCVVIGSLLGCEEPGSDEHKSIAPLDVFRERLEPLGIPVLYDLPFGHQQPNFALPVGTFADIHVDPAQLNLVGYTRE